MSVIENFIKFDDKYKAKQPQDNTTKEVMTKTEAKKNKHTIRSLGNVSAAAEAQRIYNPNLPPTKPKGPTEAQTELGASSAMDLQGNWGQSQRQE